jgi:ATPase subunit of ABC transporter with duplicated ATPase domains
MPASITLSDLSWSPPHKPPLFSHLNLRFGGLRSGLVGRNGVGKTTLLRLILGELIPQSGAIGVSGRVGTLRQVRVPASQQRVADLFDARESFACLDRVRRGEATEEEILQVDWTLESRVVAALARVELACAPETPLLAISEGERMRANLAALFFSRPDFLVLDEPTNHLDRAGRALLLRLLATWRGGCIVVSHDREVLNTMDEIVELTSLGATRYGGNWTAYREQKNIEMAAAERDLESAEKEIARVSAATSTQKERQEKRNRNGKKRGEKGGMPKILLGAQKRRAEATTGELSLLAQRKREEAATMASEARARIEVLTPFAVKLAPTGLSARKVVLDMNDVAGGYDRQCPVIRGFSLTIQGPERIAVLGANGTGKTTLLRLITGDLPTFSGSIERFSNYALLDQRVSLLDDSLSIRENFRRHHPNADEEACRAALARFKFRANAALAQVATLSGGERLRAGLACVLGACPPPPLLLLDEPTNHLDLESIETVEAGLRAYDGALVVVTHDLHLLEAISITRYVNLERA